MEETAVTNAGTLGADVMHDGNMRVVEGGGGAGLLLEAGETILVGGEAFGKNL